MSFNRSTAPVASRCIDTAGMSEGEIAIEVAAVWVDFCKKNHCSVVEPSIGSEIWKDSVLITRRIVIAKRRKGIAK